jgi:GAF domain-containing protein
VNVVDYQARLLPEASDHMAAVQAAVATPLQREGRLLGTLVVVTFDERKTFSQSDGESLEILGGLAADALVGLQRNELASLVEANRTAAAALDDSLGPTAAFSALLAGDSRLPAELRALASDVRQGVETALRSVRGRLTPSQREEEDAAGSGSARPPGE